MTPWVVLFSLCIFLGLLLSGRVRPVAAFVGLAGCYLLAGLVDAQTLLMQYTNPALITLIVLLLVSLALERSRLLSWLSSRLLQGSQRMAAARLMAGTTFMSAFLNNTAVVAMFLSAINRQRRIAPSRLLIPLSYASVLGGITTLVGTSTNLVVNSFYLSASGQELGMFQFAWVGVPVAVVTFLVVLWRSFSLPEYEREGASAQLNYFLSAGIQPDSPLVGQSIESNGLRQLDGLYLLEIERDGQLISPVMPEEILQANDTLVFTGETDRVQALQQIPGLTLFGSRADDLLATNLVEVVVSHQSILQGRTLQEVDFRSSFNAGVVGIRRGRDRLPGQLGRIPLRAGDCLLLAEGADFRQHRNLDRNFHLLDGRVTRPALKRWQNTMTLGGFVAVIGLATAGVLPLLQGLVVLLAALLLTGTLEASELRRRFPFEIWLIIGSALGIAQVFDQSGASALVAAGILQLFGQYGVYAAFIGCYLLTLACTEIVTNNAAAALAFPIAWSTAHAFGVDPMPFVMAVVYGASACFIMPFGYQTHLMVYSPGRYRISDFARIGLPTSIAYSATVLIVTPWMFPF